MQAKMLSNRSLSGSIVSAIVPNEESSSLDHSHSIFRSNDSNNTITLSSDKRSSSSSMYCRICHEDSRLEELIDPCQCSGTLALIHTSCLEKWLSTSNTEHCEICKHPFYIQRKNKSILKSVWMWWRSTHVRGTRGIAGDAVSLVVLTPLCIAATYLCGIGASAYSKLGFWEGIGLVMLCLMLIATYCLWFFVTIRFYYKSWREWRGKNQDIKLVVKHFTNEERTLIGKSSSRCLNDENVDRSTFMIMRPRQSALASWFGINLNNHDDPVYVLQQTTFV